MVSVSYQRILIKENTVPLFAHLCRPTRHSRFSVGSCLIPADPRYAVWRETDYTQQALTVSFQSFN